MQAMNSKPLKLIGIREEIECQQAYCDQGADYCDMSQYVVFLADPNDGNKRYTITFENNYRSCYSGWTYATYGEVSKLRELQYGENVGTLHWVPTDRDMMVQLLSLDKIADVELKQYGLSGRDVDFDNTSLKLLITTSSGSSLKLPVTTSSDSDGSHGSDAGHQQQWLTLANNNGGDKYYAHGFCQLNEALLTKTPRWTGKRHIYILRGASGIGKSHLASMVGGDSHSYSHTVYETDKSKKLPSNLKVHDVVVVGNKFKFTIDEIKAKYSGSDCHFISVDLSSLGVSESDSQDTDQDHTCSSDDSENHTGVNHDVDDGK